MAAKIGGFLGLLAGWIVWQMVGGIGGLLLAIFLVVPIASALFIGLFSVMGGGSKVTNTTQPPAASSTTTTENDQNREYKHENPPPGRVSCAHCGERILPSTAQKTGGICMICYKAQVRRR
jgi:hypothetical protein